jgi:uncharacterized phage protein (TIGR01671 family)
MRAIKFRGRRTDNNEWVFGHYYCDNRLDNLPTHMIITFYSHGVEQYQTDPNTTGQYTGIRDMKRTEKFPEGQEIYEGDILKYVYESKNGMKEKILIVSFNSGCFICSEKNSKFASAVGYYATLTKGNRLEVVGNVYDNSELLEEGYSC